MRISELADRVGVPASTVRYYERIGLLAAPVRTSSGYRDYDEEAAARLLFVTRARRMGLTCEQIADVLPVWDGVTCAPARDEVARLVAAKRAEIAERIAELERFAEQLGEISATLAASPPPTECRTDLSCCVPEAATDASAVALLKTRRSAGSATARRPPGLVACSHPPFLFAPPSGARPLSRMVIAAVSDVDRRWDA